MHYICRDCNNETYCRESVSGCLNGAGFVQKKATAKNDTPLDSQIGGDHYSKLGDYQPWIVLKHWLTPDELRGFAKGTAIVYAAREADKGGDQDLEKMIHTMQLYFEVKGGNPE